MALSRAKGEPIMNEASKLVYAGLAAVLLALLSAMSPVLAAIAANIIKPAIGLAVQRARAWLRRAHR